MNAEEARTMAKMANERVDVQKYLNAIKYAASQGQLKLVGDGYLTQLERERLVNLGYKVVSDMDRNEPFYTISWDDKQESRSTDDRFRDETC